MGFPTQQVEQQRALREKERQAAENKRHTDEKRQRDRELHQVCACVFATYVCECASLCGVLLRCLCMSSMYTHAARHWFMPSEAVEQYRHREAGAKISMGPGAVGARMASCLWPTISLSRARARSLSLSLSLAPAG